MSRHIKFALILFSFIILLCFLPFQGLFRSSLITADIKKAFSFSLENGFYDNDIDVALSLSSPHLQRLKIRYTLDGSTPDSYSPLYTAPFHFQAKDEPAVITIKAIVCDRNGEIAGGPYTATYFLGRQAADLANALVVSITADGRGLYSPENGILYPMTDCGPTEEDWNWFKQQNCKQRGDAWVRNAYIDIFEPDGTNAVSQGIGLCVDGDHGSMTHYPYSLKILAGREYDAEHPSFQYDIFRYYNMDGTSFPHIQNFNNMVFRNGGNEYNAGSSDPEQKGTMLRSGIGSRLADELGYMTAGSRPAIVFLNGRLYGVTQLLDTYNRHNTSAKTLLNKDRLEIYKNAELACTREGGYDKLYYSYPDIETSPIFSGENQEKLEQMVSLDDMFSYYAFQVLVNNTDFPKKNYAIWRYTGEPEGTTWTDGKFRFLINDLDCTWDFRYDDDLWTAYFHNIKEDGTVMGTLMQVEKYRIRFLNILCDLMNSGLFDRSHLDTVINEANHDFSPIASCFYSPEDEAKRQQNVLLLKDSAFARKEKVQGFIQDTFSPASPYTLFVEPPESGSSISFSTTRLTCRDNPFRGTYYGDYPMTLSAECIPYRRFSHWIINGEKITAPQVTLDASLIQNGKIKVELVTQPVISDSALLISELCAQPGNAWIELFNASDTPIQLDHYSLANNLPAIQLRFPLPNVTLQPGEVFVAGIDNTGRFRLEQGSSVYLLQESIVLDTASVPLMAQRESYGRFGETDEWRYYIHPTPGSLN